jgi:hypothetical protein
VKSGVFGALSKKAYDTAVNAAVAHDNYGFNQLIRSGMFVYLDRGTRLLILNEDFTHVSARVMRDPLNAAIRYRIVWIDCSWVK